MKKAFIPVLTIFSAFSSQALAETSQTLTEVEQLDIQAYQLYDRGQYQSALDSWEKALSLYKKGKQTDRVGRVTIEIAQAKKAMGQGVSACSTLQRYLKAEPSLCIPANGIKDIDPPTIGPTENDAIAAIDFAQLLRNFGLFEQANLYANASMRSAKENNLTELIPDLTISRANHELVKLMFDRDQWSYREKTHLTDVEATELVNRFTHVFKEYEQQINSPIGLEAKLKWLTTYQELQKQSQSFKNDALQDYPKTLRSQYISLLQDISGFNDFDQFPPSEQLRVRYDVARILNEANRHISSPSLQESSQVWIENLITVSKNLNHQTYLAFGYALLGDRYESYGQTGQAINAYILASTSSQVTHPRYRWQHTIAKLYQSLGNDRQAERFYSSAIALVEEAEFNMSPLDQSVKTHFQESVRPIFDDYIQFQLSQPQPNFSTILNLRNQYSEKVLENYLGCSIPKPIEIEDIQKTDPDAVVLSIFRINHQYVTLLENNNQFEFSRTDAEQIDNISQQLAFNFAGENQKYPVQTLNQLYQQLYQKLIQPVSSQIEPGQTILFANLQPELQRIPMALMFDGGQYLIQRNPIALVGNTLYEPQKLNSSDNDILFAGLTKPPENPSSFAEIPFVEEESRTIQPRKILLNQTFTTSNFLNQVQRDYPIVHLATHGQFSSRPDQTFLVAWNENIDLPALTQIVESRKNTGSPIELLILSACETAKGDRLAALGMAGLSIQAGARSTLASLWKAIDESSPYFMQRFYSHLEAGETKAKALQLAQVDMIEANYPPYSWGTYILTGSWL